MRFFSRLGCGSGLVQGAEVQTADYFQGVAPPRKRADYGLHYLTDRYRMGKSHDCGKSTDRAFEPALARI